MLSTEKTIAKRKAPSVEQENSQAIKAPSKAKCAKQVNQAIEIKNELNSI